MSKQAELHMTLAALALVEKEGYKIIDVRILGKEIWMNHPSNTKELIRFSLGGGFNLPRQAERTEAIRTAIEKIFGERTLMIDVSFDDEDSLYEVKGDTIFVSISPKTVDNPFLDRFPSIRAVLQTYDDKPETLTEAQQKLNLARPRNAAGGQKPKVPVATMSLIILCVSVFILQTIISEFGGYDFTVTSVFLGAYYKILILSNHEFWRFLTSGFLHMSLTHLLINMYSLYNLGIFFESKFGWKRMIVTLLVGVVSGSAFLYVTQGNAIAVGMSGGLFALLGAIVVHLVESGQIKYRPVQSMLLQLLIINGLISLMPGVAVMAHLGGFVSGVLVALYFSYKPSWKALKKHVLISTLALVAILGFLIVTDKKHTPYTKMVDTAVIKIAQDYNLTWYVQQLTDGLKAYYAKENQ